jgi:hypothetical protein
MFEDSFHEEMRRRMKINYYENGGKVRKQIRDYVTRYKIDEGLLKGYNTDELKLEKIKNIVKEEKLKKIKNEALSL